MRAPIAWCTSVGPAEILRSLGFDVYFPENHGALLGATRQATKYIPLAEQQGYSKWICSYLTSDIGAWLAKETPLTRAYGIPEVPRPDLIVFNTNQCREVAEWFNFFGREYDCPVVGIFPPRYMEDIHDPDLDGVVAQFEDLIEFGEKLSGQRFDPEKLKEAVSLSKQGSDLWKKVLATARNLPSPLTFFDGCILMAPIVVLRGTQACIDFYNEALDELEGLVRDGESAIPDERVRIYWEGMPVWGRLRALADMFSENEAAVVASTYCNSWVFDDFDSSDPLRSMARAYTQIFINRGENTKLRMINEFVKDFEIDGVVFHNSMTCFNNANSRFGLPQRLEEATGIRTVSFEGDLNDLRFYSDGQTETKLETFLDQL